MERKNLLIAGGIIGVIIVIIGVFIIIPLIGNFIFGSGNNENTLFFDNSTPEATAISIARLK